MNSSPKFTILLDDTASVNMMVWHEPDRGHVRAIPDTMYRDFCHLVETTGIRGKLSLIPFPAGIQEANPEYLGFVREMHRLRWEFSLEGLTHWMTENNIREDDFFDLESDTNIYGYLSRAYDASVQIFGVPVTGVTSPWASGANNLRNYETSIARLRREKRDSDAFIWYFLHVSYNKRDHLRIKASPFEPTVFHVPANVWDFWWESQFDGNGVANSRALERIHWLVSKGVEYITILVHWQSLFCNGSFHGLQQFKAFIEKLSAEFPQARWTTPSERITEAFPAP